MGKWLGGIITTLVILALTSFLGGILKGPIDELASGDRLKAQVQLAPWVPKPLPASDQAGATPKHSVTSKPEQDLAQIKINLENKLAITSGEDFQFARIIVTNEGSKIITDVSIRFESAIRPDLAVIVDEGDKVVTSKSTDRVKLPDLRPGDRVGVFIWGNYLSSYQIVENFKTYSSAGPFRTSFDWPSSKGFEYQSGIGKFLDEWAPLIAFGTTVLAALFLGILAGVQSVYIKAILLNERFAYSERERREKEGSKFAPDYTGAEKASKDTQR